jgi:hypothetical protein
MRLAPITAAMVLGLTASAAAQMLGPGMPMPGAGAPGGYNMGFPAPQQQQRPQMPPCMKDFMPLRAEAEKRANILKATMQKKPSREEACLQIKHFAAAEAKVVKFILANSKSCGIPPEAGKQMKANHARTLQSEHQICDGGGMAGGAPKPTGPGLSEALGTTRSGGVYDPLAPRSGTLDTLTGNVLTR